MSFRPTTEIGSCMSGIVVWLETSLIKQKNEDFSDPTGPICNHRPIPDIRLAISVVYGIIQLKYGYEGYRQFPLPRAQVYFQRRSQGK